jgi:hypothetical protein
MPLIDPAILKSITTELLNLVLLVLSGLSVYIVKLFADRLKVNLSDTQQTKVRAVATEAVFYAEEMVAKKVQTGFTGDLGSLKRAYAWQFLKKELSGVTPESAERAIHAVLGQTKGLGASKAVGT